MSNKRGIGRKDFKWLDKINEMEKYIFIEIQILWKFASIPKIIVLDSHDKQKLEMSLEMGNDKDLSPPVICKYDDKS